METLAVPEQDVLRLETAEGASRRKEPEQRVHAEGLSSRAEVAQAPERIAADEHTLMREPEGDLSPDAPPAHAAHLERSARDPCERRHM